MWRNGWRGSGVRPLYQVGLPAGLDLAEREAEPVGGRERLTMQVEPGFLRRPVHLLRVAPPARGDDVLPYMQPAARAREHVIEVLGRGTAVLASPGVAREDRPPRQRCVRTERDVDEVAKTDDRRRLHHDPLAVEDG